MNKRDTQKRTGSKSESSLLINSGKCTQKDRSEEDVRLDITVILDRSGSMQSICDDAIGSFNAFLKSRKELNPNSLMSLILFNEEYLVKKAGVPIKSIEPLTSRTYIPRGTTALFDAIGKTVQAIEEREHEDEEVMIAILTDGKENASIEYTLENIRSLILEKEAKDWDFIYLSADPLAFQDGSAMGFQASKMAMYKKEEISEAYTHMDEMLATKLSKARNIKLMKRRKKNEAEQNTQMYQ